MHVEFTGLVKGLFKKNQIISDLRYNRGSIEKENNHISIDYLISLVNYYN